VEETNTLNSLCLGPNKDRTSAWGVAEIIIQTRAAARELVAAAAAPAMVTESDVARRGKAISVRSIEAYCRTNKSGAGASADVVDPVTAIGDDCVHSANVGDGLAGEGDICVSGGKPVFELFERDQARGLVGCVVRSKIGNLKRETSSQCRAWYRRP
jgi:hypothetical protein